MPALSIQPTYPIFTDIDGQPLENGYVWIGTANLDPQSNPIDVYWDDALTQLAAQPIRTRGGYPVNAGTPSRLYVNSDYSIRVTNKNGAAIYNAPEATERYSNAIISQIDSSQVNYTPAGAGAVSTTVQAKLRETVSVLDFYANGVSGARVDPTGAIDSAAGIQAAINVAIASAAASAGTPEIIFPAGVYKLASALTVTAQNIRFRGLGWAVLKVAHNGDAITLTGIPNSYTFPRNKTVFNSLVFKTAVGNAPTSIIRLGTNSGASPTFINAINDVEINSCVFDGVTATYVIDNNRGFGLVITGCAFADTTATAVLKMRQSNTEIPYWTYAVSMYATDITNVTGKAIEADGGDLTAVGCIIEGCSNGAVEVGMNTSYTGQQPTSFYGCYFEANQNFHYKSTNSRVLSNFTGCKFIKGIAASTVLTFASAQQVVFTNCSSPNQGPTITGGNIKMVGCNYMQQNLGATDSFSTDRNTLYTSTPTTAVVFDGLNGYGPRVKRYPSIGGGGAILLCSHSAYPTASSSVTEVFMLMFTIGGSVNAVSMGRHENGDTSTFSFGTNGDYLTVTASQAGHANYTLIATSAYPAFLPG